MTRSLRISQVNIPPGLIDLGLGDPQFELLPLNLLRQAAGQRFSAGDPAFLQYGAEQGDGYFRLALAKFLGQGYGFSVDPDSLLVTSGSSGGLDLLCTLFTQPGDTIFVEEPSYFLALRIFADHGLRVVSIPMDEDGLRIDLLQERLGDIRPKFVYTIPVFQNPSGRTLSAARRQQLVSLASEYDFLIVADEVYHFLAYTRTPPTPFAGMVDSPNVVALNSFSKILAPGLRLGWLQAYPSIISRLASCGLLDSGGGMNPFTSAIVRGLVENGGLADNIARLQAIYSARLYAMATTLEEYLPEASFTLPDGGFFVWVRLPQNINASDLQRKAQAFQVNFRPGARFSSQDGLKEYLRIGFSFYDIPDLQTGIQRLADCLHSR